MNTLILDNIEDAQAELEKRKNNFPDLIHTVKNESNLLIIETMSTDEYIDKIYFQQTGKRRTGINKSILNLFKNVAGLLDERFKK